MEAQGSLRRARGLFSLRMIALGAALLLAALAAGPQPAGAVSFVVDTTADDPGVTLQGCAGAAGDCSLRGAITRANLSSAGDVISFDPAVFPSGAPASITIASELPAVAGAGDTIDGTGAGVIVDGTGESQSFYCFFVAGTGITLKGLQVTDCSLAILVASVAGNNITIGPGNVLFDNSTAIATSDETSDSIIIGNKIGTDATGTATPADFANFNGIEINGANHTIGGVNAADRNIISGNTVGINVTSSATGANMIGNYIGTDATGTVDLGNALRGIQVGASGNFIGGTGSGEGNLISGNGLFNLQIFTESAVGNVVAGNIIGPDVNGVGAAMGVVTNVAISGGADANILGPGNVISNGSFGVSIQDAGTTGNVVKGNRIGTNPAGSAGVPNTASGVRINSASGNTVGGTAPGDGNTIAFNGFNGVLVENAGATTNRIRGNSIHDNADIEINNESGGNFELAAPAVTAAGSNAAGGTACADCEVDVFSDGASDAEFYEGSVTANASGQWVLYTSIAGPNVTATNTDSTGNTSELSAARSITLSLDADSDGVPDTLDNCSAADNTNQADTDSDGAGDECDADDDGDSLADGSDSCPVLAEDFDGFEDTNGCPDPDNDLDGVCDVGQRSVSCTGEDRGRLCFDPAGVLICPLQSCQNQTEDIDAFKDSDGCPEPDNDNDGMPDGTDECPGTDSLAGVDGMLGSPQDANHNGISDGAEGPLSTDDSPGALAFEDYDGVLDGDGCHDSPGADFDGDGYPDDAEAATLFCGNGQNNDPADDAVIDDGCPGGPAVAGGFSEGSLRIGTNAGHPCGGNGWPSDLVSSGTSVNKLDIFDLVSFIASPRKLDKSPGPGSAYNPRWDLKPGPNAPFANHINIIDLTTLLQGPAGSPAYPPMFGGLRAFGRVCPLAP